MVFENVVNYYSRNKVITLRIAALCSLISSVFYGISLIQYNNSKYYIKNIGMLYGYSNRFPSLSSTPYAWFGLRAYIVNNTYITYKDCINTYKFCDSCQYAGYVFLILNLIAIVLSIITVLICLARTHTQFYTNEILKNIGISCAINTCLAGIAAYIYFHFVCMNAILDNTSMGVRHAYAMNLTLVASAIQVFFVALTNVFVTTKL